MSELNKTLAKWDIDLARPGWPTKIRAEYIAATQFDSKNQNKDSATNKLRDYFEQKLFDGKIYLDSHGPNQDAERQKIDKVVIHHTSQSPNIKLSQLNTIHFLNIYLPEFFKDLNRPIWSGHFYKNRQVFWGYHWLIRNDGSSERILNDENIGWQAGNWDVNCRSVGICLDNDFELANPTNRILSGVAQVIKRHYPKISPDNILGHCDCRLGTVCPGSDFALWRPRLIKLIYN